MRYLLTIGGLLLAAAPLSAFGLPPSTAQAATLIAQAETPAPPAGDSPPPPANGPGTPQAETEGDGSLRVCNETANPVSIALGYRAERGWQSEGWWIAGPNECKTVYSGDVEARRYYYIYAADDVGGGSWDGNVFMCTRDETFTIFGVEDCLARGYERTGFFEIDTHNRSSWMLQLTENNQVPGAEPGDGVEAGMPLEGDMDGGDAEDQPDGAESAVDQ